MFSTKLKIVVFVFASEHSNNGVTEHISSRNNDPMSSLSQYMNNPLMTGQTSQNTDYVPSFKDDDLTKLLSEIWEKPDQSVGGNTAGTQGPGTSLNENRPLKRKVYDRRDSAIDSTGSGDSSPSAVTTTTTKAPSTGKTPSEKNQLLANLLLETPVSQELLFQKIQKVDPCSVPQAKLPKKDLLSKVNNMKQNTILQGTPNGGGGRRRSSSGNSQKETAPQTPTQTWKGPGRAPFNSNSKNSDKGPNSLWDNPTTNPNSPFPGNTDKNNGLVPSTQHDIKVSENSSLSSSMAGINNASSDNAEKFLSQLLQQQQQQDSFDLSSVFNTAPQHNDATNTLDSTSMFHQQPPPSHNDASTNSFIHGQSMISDDTNFESQLEQLLGGSGDTNFTPAELDTILGFTSSPSSSLTGGSTSQRGFNNNNNPVDSLNEQLQIDKIRQQLMSSETTNTKLQGKFIHFIFCHLFLTISCGIFVFAVLLFAFISRSINLVVAF